MRTLVFDIKGDYGHFKKPYSPMSPVTFSFPPPPAVLGLIGAVLGLPKEQYHEKLDWEKVMIGVRLLSPVHVFRTAINLLNTKDGTDKYLRPRAHANTHIQVNFEFLKNPAFRIFVAGLSSSMHDRLKHLLEGQQSVFTPVLGLAQCLADIGWVGETNARKVTEKAATISSVISLNDGISPRYKPGMRYHRTRIPAVMDGQRIVHRYQEILLTENGSPIECNLNGEIGVYRVGDETVSFL